jgi:crotonobetainyl-CoA:carnitine CoA-transferase CaiB-like acyl-CoA transferase
MDLSGVRILDLTQILPGPYATQLLADMGADVVKIENPDGGDFARYLTPRTERDVGAVFDCTNRNKRSVTLDLKDESDTEAFYELVEGADVVFEGFRPGVAERLGVDYDDLRSYNEDLVYCSLSGYGQEGPLAERAGFDLNYVGFAGLLDLTRSDEAETPRILGFPVADMAGGLFAAFSIVGALHSRSLGNQGGEYIDVAMTDVILSFSQTHSYEALTGESPRPGVTPINGKFPWYGVYETADGRYVTLTATQEVFWESFCDAVDRPDLVDAFLSDDESELEVLRGELKELFRRKTQAEWEETFADADTSFGIVNTLAEAVDHPQTEARNLVKESVEAPPRIGFPAVLSEGLPDSDEAVPTLGEHNTEFLQTDER